MILSLGLGYLLPAMDNTKQTAQNSNSTSSTEPPRMVTEPVNPPTPPVIDPQPVPSNQPPASPPPTPQATVPTFTTPAEPAFTISSDPTSTTPASPPPPSETLTVSSATPPPPPKKGVSKKLVGSLAALVLLSFGLVAGLLVVKQNQDIRQRAAGPARCVGTESNPAAGSSCSCTSSGTTCTGPFIYRFICDGDVSQCGNGVGVPISEDNIGNTNGVACNKTVQIDVFSRNCRPDGINWVCGGRESDLMNYAIWYSGECSNVPVCPYTSTQAQVQIDANDPWGDSKTINLGQSVNLAGFHDGTGQFPTTMDVDFTITRQGGGIPQTLTPPNPPQRVIVFTPTQPGVYDFVGRTKDANGNYYPETSCQDTGTITVIGPTPTPTPVATPGSTPQPTPTPTPLPSASPLAQCLNIKFYSVSGNISNSSSWTQLTATDLAALSPADIIYVTITGGNTTGGATIDKARIRVNATSWSPADETTDIKPKANTSEPDEYYVTYTIPPFGNGPSSTFTFGAEVHDATGDRWF